MRYTYNAVRYIAPQCMREEDKRKIYEITPLGAEILELEKKRIERLYRNSREELI